MKGQWTYVALALLVGTAACNDRQQSALENSAQSTADKLDQQTDRLDNTIDRAADKADEKLDSLGQGARTAAGKMEHAGNEAAADVENAARR